MTAFGNAKLAGRDEIQLGRPEREPRGEEAAHRVLETGRSLRGAGRQNARKAHFSLTVHAQGLTLIAPFHQEKQLVGEDPGVAGCRLSANRGDLLTPRLSPRLT